MVTVFPIRDEHKLELVDFTGEPRLTLPADTTFKAARAAAVDQGFWLVEQDVPRGAQGN